MIATPFSKLLVANRGEIAVRVMRTARRMGYRTVAVHSDPDADAVHAAAADQAVAIGGELPRESYLDIDKIIAAARVTGADAIHPGYGFLAENARFAAACRAAGLVFVGPSPDAISSMGDKAEAKRLMLAAGVPCIPGYQGSDQSEARLFAEAETIGWPVMIKAVAGGGGRGMRLVTAAESFADALASAKSEAQAAFGNAEMLLERAIIDPRHIEIQIVADRHGNAVHLGERDCSVQRRHQKVIEEAPSPAVDADLRARMGDTAITAALAIGYEGAGTFEFLLDRDGCYYFMEMNTRLQVEHPVTEAITGLDLVELQLRVAAGEPLPIRQDQVRISGHAIEVRLCAENPDAGFIPCSGTMTSWQPSGQVRVDHAVRSGTVISPYYDSMIAKLISHGPSREDARRQIANGLRETIALGVTTNGAFAGRCLAHPIFVEGAATTAFIATAGDDLRRPEQVEGEVASIAAVLLSAVGVPSFGVAPSLAYDGPVGFRLKIGNAIHEIIVTRKGGSAFDVARGDVVETIGIGGIADGKAIIVRDGIASTVAWVETADRLLLHYEGDAFEIVDLSFAARDGGAAVTRDGNIRASMTGRVVEVAAVVGDAVAAGQSIVTIEAMKMEQRHLASVAGVLRALHVATGDQVAAGRIVAEIAVDSSPSGEAGQ